MTYQAGTTVFDHTQGHVCNCIGCCRVCGQCRTSLWHMATCADIAKSNAERAAIIGRARRSLDLPRNSGEVAAVNGLTTVREKDEAHT
jgi:hypothetical protein